MVEQFEVDTSVKYNVSSMLNKYDQAKADIVEAWFDYTKRRALSQNEFMEAARVLERISEANGVDIIREIARELPQ